MKHTLPNADKRISWNGNISSQVEQLEMIDRTIDHCEWKEQMAMSCLSLIEGQSVRGERDDEPSRAPIN